MTDYARDAQGRPISEDGRWAWNGTEWEPHQAQQDATVTPAETDASLSAVQPSVDVDAEPVPEASSTPAHGGELRGAVHSTVTPPSKVRSASSSGRFSRSVTVTSARDDEMTPGRLVATTVGVVLALGGALLFGVSIATILIVRAYEKAMEEAFATGNSDLLAGAGPGASSPDTTVAMIYALSFVVATLAAFSVLYAAKVPMAIVGAVAIVLVSYAAYWVIGQSGIEAQSMTGIFLLPLVPAAATAGFIKWASR